MIEIKDTLVLDHFFFGFSVEQFESLEQILSPFRWCTSSTVKTDNDQWSGIYLKSRNQVYFEGLKSRSDCTLGICLSPFVHSIDPAPIVEQEPDFKWKHSVRKINQQIWYETFSTAEY